MNSKYLKTIIATIGGVVTSSLVLFPPDSTTFKVLTVVSAALTAVLVYAFPNGDGT